MNFEKYFRLIYEDAASQEKQAINILKRKKITNAEEIIEQLKKLSEPFASDKGARNNGHLPYITQTIIRTLRYQFIKLLKIHICTYSSSSSGL
jgi:hypothetical protein